MPLFTKQKSTLHLLLTNSDQATAHGGQVLVDALCRRFGLWKRIHQTPSLDPRKRTGAGFSPVANVAQLLFTLTSGGASLADAERLGQDRVLLHLLGPAKGADQTTPGQPSGQSGAGGCTPGRRRCFLTTPKSKSRAISLKGRASTMRAIGH